jgi:hypothetical protein
MPSPPFDIIFDEQTCEHLEVLDSKYDAFIRDAIEQQLRHQPDAGTRNRKELRLPAPFGAAWELRCGPGNRLRIFYDVDTAQRVVIVLAIGVKVGNTLWIGGEEYAT